MIAITGNNHSQDRRADSFYKNILPASMKHDQPETNRGVGREMRRIPF